MSSDTGDSQEAMPDSEATVIRSTTGGAVSGSKDIRLEFIEKIRNHHFSFQKYQVQDKIGQGGMGSIHKGFDKNLHRTSVLKIILPNIQDDPSLFKQFIREAQITARLEHPNIIPVHDIGVIDGDKLHFAMKEVHGETLADILAEVKKAAPEKPRRFSFFALLTIFRKVCDAVAFAHSKGILHRDIKPDNIMVGNFGEVLLMDWGLAKLFDAEELQLPSDLDESLVPTLSPETTLSGVVKGSPAFMSPEQAKGQSELLDERSDVFLLGATLYNIATLSSPYTSANIEQTLNNAQQGTLSNPDLLASINTIPPDLTRIIEKTMALEPKQRYQKVDELIADIDAVLEGNTSATTKVFQAGEIIIKEGDVGEEAFLISSGRVKVFKTTDSGEVELFTLNHGDVIGEMALITKSVRSASIRALEQTELVMITREVMEQGLSQLPFWLKTTVNCLTERLAHANANVHPLINNDCLYHVMRQLQFSYLSFTGALRAHGNDSPAAVNTATVIDDIATNLCIPSDRVERVVNGLIEQGIGQRQGNDMFAIADTAILDALVRRAAQQQSVEVAADRPGLMGEGVPDKPGDAVGGHKLDGILQTLRSQL